MQIDYSDLRKEPRRESSHSVLVRFESQDGASKAVKHVADTADISASGVKIVTRRPMVLGTQLPLSLTSTNPPETFDFMGEVKWCLEVDDVPTFYVGIKLSNFDQQNYKNWLNLVKVGAGRQH